MYIPFRGGADTSKATGCRIVFPTCTTKGTRLLLPKGPFFFPEEESFQDLHSHMKLHYVFFRFLTALPSSLANFVTHITKHTYVYICISQGPPPGSGGVGIPRRPTIWAGRQRGGFAPRRQPRGCPPFCGAPGTPTRAAVAQVHSKPGEARPWRGRRTSADLFPLGAAFPPPPPQPDGAAPRRGAPPGSVGRRSG